MQVVGLKREPPARHVFHRRRPPGAFTGQHGERMPGTSLSLLPALCSPSTTTTLPAQPSFMHHLVQSQRSAVNEILVGDVIEVRGWHVRVWASCCCVCPQSNP